MSNPGHLTNILLCASFDDEPLVHQHLAPWMTKREHEPLFCVDTFAAGDQAMQQYVGIGAYRDLDHQAFVSYVMGLGWTQRSRVVLILQSQDGPAQVHRLAN